MATRSLNRFGVVLAIAAFSVSPGAAGAQVPGTANEPSPLERLEVEIAETRSRLEEWRVKAAEYAEAWEQAPARAAQLEREIRELEAGPPIEIPADATVSELDGALEAAGLDLDDARRRLVAFEEQLSSRAERRRAIPKLLKAAQARLAQVPPVEESQVGDDSEIDQGRKELTRLRASAIEEEIRAYKEELASYEERGTVVSLERDLAVLEIAHYEKLTLALREALKDEQQDAVEQATEQARQLLDSVGHAPEGFRALINELVEENETLAKRWTGATGVGERIDDLSEKLMRAEAQIEDVDGALRNLREQIAAVGLVDSVGLMLRRQRREAPDIGMYRRFIRMREPEIGEVQLAQIQLRGRRQELSDIDAVVAETMSEAADSMDAEDRKRVESALRELLLTQREYLDELVADYETYFEKLVDFDARQRQLIDRTETLTEFIDSRVLWVPSGGLVGRDTVDLGAEGAQWLAKSKNLGQLRDALGGLFARDWWMFLLLGAATLLVLGYTPRIRRRIAELGAQARSFATTSFTPTMRAIALSLLLVPWLPALLILTGWRLSTAAEATEYVRSVSHGVVATGVFWLTLRFVSEMLRPGGIAEAHAKFPSECCASLRKHLVWFQLITLPCVFVIFVFEAHGDVHWSESTGRLAFVVAMLAAAAYAVVVVRPGGPLAALYKLDHDNTRRKYWWAVARVFAVMVPIALMIGALSGYYWTALQLAFRYHLTLLFALTSKIVFNLLLHWALLARRRVARDQIRKGEEEAHEEALDMVTVETQTQSLLRGSMVLFAAVGVLLIWAEILPAVGILEHVELWDTTRTVTLSLQDATGVAREATETRLVPVTLADLFGALLIGLIAFALVRNLPGLLDVSLFRRLSAGERYAYSTLVKYAIALAGVAFALGAIGIGWANIQWLVAAVGVGLGFGLQEIFANLISGLIILFERPIRVGDTVTIGSISGVVSKIRTRATWITGFDRRELVVPNKEFITQQLINWSLSDGVLRIDVAVGIAYGSDTNKAVEVLSKLAKEHPRVMKDPAPQVLFVGFGDSSLNFELRAFLPDVREFIVAKHELHLAVDAAFREAGIEIAFPQRDLHLRSIPQGWTVGAAAE